MGIISQYSIAITIDLRVYSECAIVDDISDTLLQFHQSGLDLNDVEVVMTDLSGFQIHLVDDMIDDLKRMPLFQLISIKEQASDNYKAKWKKHCLEAKAKVSEPQNLK